MRFRVLTAALSAVECHGADTEVTSICADSRDVAPGSLFVAVPGFKVDGHRFVLEALGRGAAALILQRDHVGSGLLPPAPLAIVDDSRSALAGAAALFYGEPGEHLRVIGVTGTDGKTTTSYLINAVLEGAGHQTGMLGTVDFKVGARWWSNDSRLTTPGAPEVQALLAEMVLAGADYAIVESTSHGLELHRLDRCRYDVAVFTNLSPDHLDQHGTLEAYRAAKGRLFAMLGEPTTKQGRRYSVLNYDDAEFDYFCSVSRAPVVSYGLASEADVRAEQITAAPAGTSMRVRTTTGDFPLDYPLPGLFNVSNALAAIAVGVEEGIPIDSIRRSLEGFGGVPGRMERIDAGQPFAVIVDYAHTGEALGKVLKTLRPGTRGRIIAVFGSAGERGHTRRTGMAAAAAALSDYTVLTDEDPRSEDPVTIIDEMAGVLHAAGRREPGDYVRILDRQAAIVEAVRRAGPDDLVLIAGKGHEQSIEMHGQKLPWDDRRAARRALAELGFAGTSRGAG